MFLKERCVHFKARLIVKFKDFHYESIPALEKPSPCGHFVDWSYKPPTVADKLRDKNNLLKEQIKALKKQNKALLQYRNVRQDLYEPLNIDAT